MYSRLQVLFNFKKMDAEVRANRETEAHRLLDFSFEIGHFQKQSGSLFLHEHPAYALSWQRDTAIALCSAEGFVKDVFDQCRFGLTSPAGLPLEKATGLLHNMPAASARFQNVRCACCQFFEFEGRHRLHRPIMGGEMGHKMSVWAQTYPPQMVAAIVEAADDAISASDSNAISNSDLP